MKYSCTAFTATTTGQSSRASWDIGLSDGTSGQTGGLAHV